MNEELELKYRIDNVVAVRATIDALVPLSDAETWRRLSITDRYFDTPDEALAKAGYGARLRRIGGQTVLTLKSDLEVADGLHRRIELEAPASKVLDARRWPDSAARRRLLEIVGERRLVVSFAVRQRRLERHVSLGRAQLAVSLDTAQVSHLGMPVGTLAQLEVERRSGRRAGLETFGRLLDDAHVGIRESRSKLALAAEQVAQAAPIRPTDDFAEAGRKVLRRHLLRMLEREIALRADDPEALRQMRVATRRMRASWRLFGDAFRKREERRYVAELRRVAGALGEVRDLDVLLATLPTTKAMAPLAEEWRQLRGAARERLDHLLGSADYEAFVADYLALTGERGAGVARRRATHVGVEVDKRVATAAARLRAAGAAALGSGEDAIWHALRIAVKRLRYTLEAFRDVLDPPATEAWIARLRTAQDALGRMNDAAVAARAAETWLASNRNTLTAATVTAVERFAKKRRAAVLDARDKFSLGQLTDN